MIEDALTATRALHRLLLAASAVALVFVFSLADVRSERRLLEDVRRLRTLPLAEYKNFIQERAAASLNPTLERSALQFAQEFERQISSAGLRVFATGQIPGAFAKPLHVGRLDPEQLILSSPEATLNQLDRVLADLPIDQDAQIVHAAPFNLIPRIVTFLTDRIAAGPLGPATVSIVNVQISLVDGPTEGAETFLPPGSEPELLLYFELNRENQADPVYEGKFQGRVEVLPETSWRYWLNHKANTADLYSMVDGQFRWLGQHNLPPTLRNKPIKTLEEDLAKKMEDATARNRTIDLPGVSVPGSLALFAIPIILLGLASSLAQHLDHLKRLAPDYPKEFVQFAWTPLTLGASWRREVILTTILLPVLAQALLVWRYDAFDLPASLVGLTGSAGAIGSILIGRKLLQRLGSLRTAMGKDRGVVAPP
jgi:hypothetical protein